MQPVTEPIIVSREMNTNRTTVVSASETSAILVGEQRGSTGVNA